MRALLVIALAAFSTQWAWAHKADKDLDLGHWYIEGAYTAAELKDAETTVQAQTASCGNLLNVLPGPLGCNLGVNNLLVLFPNNAGPGFSQTFTTEYDNGDGFEASVGYDFPGAFRLDLNYVKFENDIERINNAVATGTIESEQLMGNLWLDFNEDGVVQPYVGLGLGAARIDIGDADDTVMTAQAGLGLNFAVGAHLKINLGYRYFEGKDPEFTNATSNLVSEYAGQRAMLGFRYDFLRDPPVPPDADGDGVPDKNDRCPRTPREAKVDGFGCPLDSDRDGVADYLDQCPGTPAGVKVDERGCDLDTDGDGVPNSLDKCPETPAGKRVLANGCQSVVLQGVNYVSGSAELTNYAMQVCVDVARVLNSPAAADLIVELQGHTDSQGADTYNLALSQQRAESMRSCLIQNGVAASRLRAKGYGEYQPVASNLTADGRAKNRRTEMKVLNN